MSINIAIGSSPTGPLLAQANRQGQLRLPLVRIKPAEGALTSILLHRITISFLGDDKGVSTLNSAYPFGSLGEPIELLPEGTTCEPLSLKPESNDLPSGDYTLCVEAEYQRGPNFPGDKYGPKLVVRSERHLEIPFDIPRPCGLSVNWKRREALVDHTAAELEINAERLPAGAMLDVSVLDPTDILIPELRTAIETAIRQKPAVRIGDANPLGRTKFHLKIDIAKLDSRTREATLRRAPLAVELIIKARVESRPASEHRPAEYEELGSLPLKNDLALLIDFSQNVFHGFPILDIGTSSIFAVIHWSGMDTGLLPLEQEQVYRSRLTELLKPAKDAFAGAVWDRLVEGAARTLFGNLNGSTKPREAIFEHLQQNLPNRESHTDSEMHRVIRALELQATMLNSFSATERLTIRRYFSQLHSQAFRRFPLRNRRLVPVSLDSTLGVTRRHEGEIAQPIPSTTEVVKAGRKKGELQLEIGPQAHAHRRDAMSTNPEQLGYMFHSSPKLYYETLGRLGETVKVTSGGDVIEVTPRDFLVASLIHLRKRIEAFRDGNQEGIQLPETRFNKIVLTFPTSAPLNVRTELVEIAQEAGFDKPIVDLDEALSAIILHLVKPFGDDKELGLEGFRTACRPIIPPDGSVPHEWFQNILLIDVGAGTTDIALVEARLSDETPRTLDSALGRYYRLTPTLLGATGRGHLAGNRLTLNLFHDLKKRIADAILTHHAHLTARTDGDTEFLGRVTLALGTLSPPFGSAGSYTPGSILEHYRTLQLWRTGNHPEAPEAYRLVERVMATSWKGPDARRSSSIRFQELWDVAETLKIAMSQNNKDSYTLDAEQLAKILGISAELAATLPPVALTKANFLTAIDPPLREIAELAVNLVKSRLTRADPPSKPNAEASMNRTLDRIILAGRTCILPRVKEKIVDQFRLACEDSNSSLRWNPSQIIFEEEYAKQAAAIGASYAQVLREARVPPSVFGPISGNQFDVNIDNLFSYLSSGFDLRTGGAEETSVLLPIGRKFQYYDKNRVGHLRGEWTIKPSLTLAIERRDIDTQRGPLWGVFDCKELSEQAGISWNRFQNEVRAAIETDHRLIVKLLFCRGSEPHYKLPLTTLGWTLAEKLAELRPAPAQGVAPAPPLASGESSRTWLKSLKEWVLIVNENSQYPGELLSLSTEMFDKAVQPAGTEKVEGLKTFRRSDGTEVRGFVSIPLPSCPESGLDHFSIRPADGNRGPVMLGSIRRPQPEDDEPLPIRVVLTEFGELFLLEGNLEFVTSDDPKDLQRNGIIVERPLVPAQEESDELTDPFCGRH